MKIGEYMELPVVMTFDKDKEITGEVLQEFINKHQLELPRYKKLMDMYKGNTDIFQLEDKDDYKPDNRLSSGMARYITDTFTGYFNGIPVKKTHPNENIANAIEEFEANNDIEDKEHELAKLCCVLGRVYEGVYQNEDTETKTYYVSPENAFIVYDDTVDQARLFGCVYTMKEDGTIKGTLYTKSHSIEFVKNGDSNDGIKLLEDKVTDNVYSDLNFHEYYLNEERMGLFEPVKTMIDSHDKAISEKANDVDYFSDSYLKMLGLPIDEDGIKNIRDNRIINASGQGSENAVVEFIDKPDSDQMTENFLDRLERLIFQMSMVANLSDENFGQSSGTALAYKLQAMSNLALSFQRKFESSLRERYELLFSVTTNFSEGEADEWKQIEYIFNRNQPNNLKEEVEAANMMMGITSEKTALSVISKIPDVNKELQQKDKEMQKAVKRGSEDLMPEKEVVIDG